MKTPTISAVLDDLACSRWLHQAILALLDRDCVDAARDAELLARLFSDRANTILSDRVKGGERIERDT